MNPIHQHVIRQVFKPTMFHKFIYKLCVLNWGHIMVIILKVGRESFSGYHQTWLLDRTELEGILINILKFCREALLTCDISLFIYKNTLSSNSDCFTVFEQVL